MSQAHCSCCGSRRVGRCGAACCHGGKGPNLAADTYLGTQEAGKGLLRFIVLLNATLCL